MEWKRRKEGDISGKNREKTKGQRKGRKGKQGLKREKNKNGGKKGERGVSLFVERMKEPLSLRERQVNWIYQVKLGRATVDRKGLSKLCGNW